MAVAGRLEEVTLLEETLTLLQHRASSSELGAFPQPYQVRLASLYCMPLVLDDYSATSRPHTRPLPWRSYSPITKKVGGTEQRMLLAQRSKLRAHWELQLEQAALGCWHVLMAQLLPLGDSA